MDTLAEKLRRHGVRLNDVNDDDGLKHVFYSEVSRGAVAAFDPTLVIYLLPSPVIAIASHFRRGWPGAQLCKLRGLDNADRDLGSAGGGIPGLLAALAPTQRGPNGSVPLTSFAELAAARSGVDVFGFEAHAASWLQASELGYTVWFATLEDVVRHQDLLAALLGLPPEPDPLFRFPLRNATPVRQRVFGGTLLPDAFIGLYAAIEERLVQQFRGRCATAATSMPPGGSALNTSRSTLCAGRLPIHPASALQNATLIRLHAPVWASRAALAYSWKAYLLSRSGPCRGLLRPPSSGSSNVAPAPLAVVRARQQFRRKRPR